MSAVVPYRNISANTVEPIDAPEPGHLRDPKLLQVAPLPFLLLSLTRSRRQRYFGQSANGLGRSWKCTTFGRFSLPPSAWKGVRVPQVVHTPFPRHPPLGSSMRPSMPLT